MTLWHLGYRCLQYLDTNIDKDTNLQTMNNYDIHKNINTYTKLEIVTWCRICILALTLNISPHPPHISDFMRGFLLIYILAKLRVGLEHRETKRWQEFMQWKERSSWQSVTFLIFTFLSLSGKTSDKLLCNSSYLPTSSWFTTLVHSWATIGAKFYKNIKFELLF